MQMHINIRLEIWISVYSENKNMVYLSDKDLEETSDGTADAVLGSLLSIAHDVYVYVCMCVRVWV